MFLQEIDISNFSPAIVNVPGYLAFVDKGLKKRTCTLVRQGIFENVVQVFCCGGAPQVWLQVTHNGQKATLVNVYREWCKEQKRVIEELKNNVLGISNTSRKIIIAGDFNLNPNRSADADYPSHHMTSSFLSSLAEMGLERYSFGDTFSRVVEEQVRSSELDWLVSNCNVTDLHQERYGLSDHSIVLWKWKRGPQKSKTSHALLRNLNKIDRVNFGKDLSMQPWECIGDPDMKTEMMAMKFNSLFLQVLDKHAPLRQVTTKRKRTPKPSIDLQRLRRQRDNARSKGQLHKLRHLRSQCNKVSKIEMMNHAKMRIQRDGNNAWKLVNENLGKSGQAGNTNAITNDEGTTLTVKEAAIEFNGFFIQKIEKIRQSIPKTKVDPLYGAKKRAMGLNLHEGAFHLRTVSEKEIQQAIRNSKGSSCPDYFGISPAALKLAPEVVSVPLTWIINKIIATSTIPECWKIAKVLPLHKKKSKDKVENYRPVSILPSPSKIMEMIIQRQFSAYFEKNGILPSSQFGFRRNLSTIHAIGAADHDWKKSRQKGLDCGALFFDLSAAFDTIDVGLLTSKLITYGAGKGVIAWVRSYLTKRRQCVDYGGETSPLVNVETGSPQGSVVSPLLFLILVADIEEWITEAKALSYADDTTVYYAADTKPKVRAALELAADEVLLFMQATMLSANPSKTKFVMFGRRKEEPLRVGNVFIEESKDETLLGITVNKSLSWTSHVGSLMGELRKRIGVLHRLTFELPVEIVKLMIQPIFTSKLLYGLSLLASDTGPLKKNTLLRQLSSLHQQAMKSALRIRKRQSVSYCDLLEYTGQKSVFQLALDQLSITACKCLTADAHPLVNSRLEKHLGIKRTRQSERTWPPQSTRGSLITRMVEVWECLPCNICEEESNFRRNKLIKKWSAKTLCDT